MGDQQAWEQLNGGNLEGNPNPSTISRDQWDRVEDRMAEIMYQIQPTEVSETRRKAVIDYIQRLIRGCLGAEVFPFGSVPLKTYLPDGDIDLSAFSTSQNVEDLLANDVRLVLEGEEQNKASEFEVGDVQYINAEVKLVKCLVQNIVVDISVNQLGGLCTLCFLEQVDRIIAKQHLFKRSIILIKAWCYYESRILGAHHGLISTYALETLVLYIFQHFHSSLHGPLEVLYRFLDYFSQFNWDRYCVTLNGPVSLSVLPEMTVESVENDGYDLLLSEELLKNCTEIYSVPAKLTDTPRFFPLKHLNIVDPLKGNNNLGRSVSRGNFFRIRSAFGYGARKLGRILLSAETDITEELTNFFMNTLDRHGTGQRPDVQNPNPNIHEPSFGITAFSAAASPDAEGHEKGPRLPKADVSTEPAEQVTEHCDSVQNVSESGLLMGYNASIPEEQAVVSRTPFGNEKDLVSCMIFAQTSGKGTMVESGHEPSNSPSERISEMTQIQFSRANTFPGWGVGHVLDPSGICTTSEKKVPFWHWVSQGQAPFPLEDAERSAYAANNAPQFVGSNSGSNLETTVSYGSAGTLPDTNTLVKYTGLRTGSPGVCESVGQLSDLTGELDNHKQSLACGRWYYESAMFGPVLPFRMVAGSYLQSHPLYDGVYQTPVPKNMYRYLPSNGMISGPPFPPTNRFYHRNPTMFSGGFSNEDTPTKHRGTGTYFPSVNQHVHRDRQSVGRGRHHATPNHSTTQRPRNNGQGVTVGAEYIASGHRVGESRLESSSCETPGQELLRPSFNASSDSDMASWPKLPSSTVEPVHPFGGGHGGPRPTMRAALGGNVRPPSTEGLEFGSLGSLPKPDRRRHEPDSGSMRASLPSQPNSSAQRPVLALNIEKPSHSYHMKDEDFPPLSV